MKKIIFLLFYLIAFGQQVLCQDNSIQKYYDQFELYCIIQNVFVSGMFNDEQVGTVHIKGFTKEIKLQNLKYYTILTIKVNNSIYMTYGYAPYVNDNYGNSILPKYHAIFCIVKKDIGEEKSKTTFFKEVVLIKTESKDNIYTQLIPLDVGSYCVVQDLTRVYYLNDSQYAISFWPDEYDFK